VFATAWEVRWRSSFEKAWVNLSSAAFKVGLLSRGQTSITSSRPTIVELLIFYERNSPRTWYGIRT